MPQKLPLAAEPPGEESKEAQYQHAMRRLEAFLHDEEVLAKQDGGATQAVDTQLVAEPRQYRAPSPPAPRRGPTAVGNGQRKKKRKRSRASVAARADTTRPAAFKKHVQVVFALSASMHAFLLSLPLLALQTPKLIQNNVDTRSYLVTALVAGAMIFFGSALAVARNRIAIRSGRDLSMFLAKALVHHGRTGSTSASNQSDIDRVRHTLFGPAGLALADLAFVPLYLMVAVIVSPWLGLLIGALLGASALVCWIGHSRNDAAHSATLENLSNARTLTENLSSDDQHLMALQKHSTYRRNWLESFSKVTAEELAGLDDHHDGIANLVLVRNIGVAIVLVVSVLASANGVVDAGPLMAVLLIYTFCCFSLETVVRHLPQLAGAHRSVRKIEHQLATQKAPKDDSAINVNEWHGDLKLVAGRIAGGSSRFVLKDLNLETGPGKLCVISGKSGSGRSLLAATLAGRHPLAGGELLLDGHSLSQMPACTLISAIGYMEQEPLLLRGTVAENIRRFQTDAREADIVAAARAAGIDHLIERLPHGYLTLVGPEQKLPASLKRQIALARAFYGHPPLVVLDEPLGRHDQFAEQALVRAIDMLLRDGCTLVVVSQSPAVLQFADVIYDLDRRIALAPSANSVNPIELEARAATSAIDELFEADELLPNGTENG